MRKKPALLAALAGSTALAAGGFVALAAGGFVALAAGGSTALAAGGSTALAAGGSTALAAGGSAALIAGSTMLTAGPARSGGDPTELARRAMSGDSGSLGSIESLFEPLFARKDLWTLDEAAGTREAAHLAGRDGRGPEVHWFVIPAEGAAMRLLAVDFGLIVEPAGSGKSGYVAYGIVEKGGDGSPKVSWYHDVGRKIQEQGGAAWHPLAARLLDGSRGEARLLVIEAGPAAGSPAAGLLLLEDKGGDWTATRRITAPGRSRLVGWGPQGITFLTEREPPKGVLTGAPASLFRSLVLYERQEGTFAAEPIVAPVPEVVTATETLIAAVRRGDKEQAQRLCVSADVLEAMHYFSPGWKGGGRIVHATPTTLEIVYEEIERPTLRIEFVYQNRAGVLLLASITGKAEEKKG